MMTQSTYIISLLIEEHTSCFSLGKEKGLAFINSLDHVEGCFIDKNNQMTYSKQFQKYMK